VRILDKIFKKAEKKEPKKSIKMSLSKVEKWAGDASADIKEDLTSGMQQDADEILQAVEEAREIVEEIRDYKPPPEIKKRMFKPVKTAKPKYVKGMLDGLGIIRPMKGATYEALVDFNIRTQKAMKIIHRVQINQGRITATFFQEEMPRLGTALNRIIDSQKAIEEGIEDAEKKGERAESIKAKMRKLRVAKEAQKDQKAQAKKAQEEIKEREASRDKCKEELEKFKQSPDYQKLKELEKELADAREKLASTESKGRNILGPLIRVLRKYAREAKDKDTKKVTESYIKNPQAALFESAEGADVIIKILNEALAMAKRGEIAIEEKRREKVENAVDSLLGVKGEHNTIKKETERIKSELASSSIKEEQSALEDKLREAEMDIEVLKREAESANTNAKQKRAETKRLKKELEEALKEEMETDVVIEI
jgi:DNA repair exonuclease SbcCD ATPase subunit